MANDQQEFDMRFDLIVESIQRDLARIETLKGISGSVSLALARYLAIRVAAINQNIEDKLKILEGHFEEYQRKTRM